MSLVIAILVSNRANCAPKQKCLPQPNPRCLFGSRPISKESGSINSSGSRFAPAVERNTGCPFSKRIPSNKNESLTLRTVTFEGPSYLNISSTAESIKVGSARRRSSCAGFFKRASVPLAMRFAVVSCPAKSRRVHAPII